MQGYKLFTEHNKLSLKFNNASFSRFFFSVAPLDENEYSPGEEQADSLSSQSKSGGCSGGSSGGGSAKFRSFESGNNNVDFPSLLNVPLGSDGQGSHDSHNDSGYSTRFGYSAGPSPSLSGMLLRYR